MLPHHGKGYLWAIISKAIQVKNIFTVTIVLGLALAGANARQPLRAWGNNILLTPEITPYGTG